MSTPNVLLSRRSTSSFRIVTVFAAGAAVVLGACSDATGPGQSNVSPADARAIADFVVNLDETGPTFPSSAMAGSLATASDATPSFGGSFSFNATEDCPGGGTRSAQGQTTLTMDTIAHTATIDFMSSHAYDACVFTHDTTTTQLDGSITSKGTTQFQLSGTMVGFRRWWHPQIISFSGSREGSLTRTVNGTATTCDISLTSTYDSSTQTLTVTGTVCGRQVDYTRTRDDGGRHDG
jgi:hypothetical protein